VRGLARQLLVGGGDLGPEALDRRHLLVGLRLHGTQTRLEGDLALLDGPVVGILGLVGSKARLELGDLGRLVLIGRFQRPQIRLVERLPRLTGLGHPSRRLERQLGLCQILAQPAELGVHRAAIGPPLTVSPRSVAAYRVRADAGLDQSALKPADQRRLIAGLGPERLELGPQGDLAVEPRIAEALAIARRARGERRIEAMDLVALLGVDLGCFLERLGLLGCRLRDAGDLAVALEQELLRLRQPVLDLGQAVGDRVLEDAASVLVLLERGPELGRLALEPADRGIAPIDLDPLLGGGLGGLVDLGLEAVDRNGVLGAKPVLIGPNLGRGQRHRPLELVGREPGGATAIERRGEKPDEGRQEEPECHQHGRLNSDHRHILLSSVPCRSTLPFPRPATGTRSSDLAHNRVRLYQSDASIMA